MSISYSLHPLSWAVCLALVACGGGETNPTPPAKALVLRQCADQNQNYRCDLNEPVSDPLAPSLQEAFDPQDGGLRYVLSAPPGLPVSAYHSLLRVLTEQGHPLAAAQDLLQQRLGSDLPSTEQALLAAIASQPALGAAERIRAVAALSLAAAQVTAPPSQVLSTPPQSVASWAKAHLEEAPRSMISSDQQILIGTDKPNRLLLLTPGQSTHPVSLLTDPLAATHTESLLPPHQPVARHAMYKLDAISGASSLPKPKPPSPLPPSPSPFPPNPTDQPSKPDNPPVEAPPSEGLQQLAGGLFADTSYVLLRPTVKSGPQAQACRSLATGESANAGVFRLGLAQRPAQIALRHTLNCINPGISQIQAHPQSGSLFALDQEGQRLLQLDGQNLSATRSWTLPGKPNAMAILEHEAWIAMPSGEIQRLGLQGQTLPALQLNTPVSRILAGRDHLVLEQAQQLSIYHLFDRQPVLARRIQLSSQPSALAVDSEWLAVGFSDGRLQVYHLPSGGLRLNSQHDQAISQLSLHKQQLFFSGQGNQLYRLAWTLPH